MQSIVSSTDVGDQDFTHLVKPGHCRQIIVIVITVVIVATVSNIAVVIDINITIIIMN